jgi:L-alanine-DL-glutamate epimerase-like enolase superfamily enzyme
LAHPPIIIEAAHESWPLREAFTISRGAKTTAEVIVVTARCGAYAGRGEAVPYTRYGETVDAALEALHGLSSLTSRSDAQSLLPPGAARNALDCALWDLDAKQQARPAFELAGLAPIAPLLTCYTLSLGTPEAMAAKAASVRHLPLLKLKLGGAGDAERMLAVRAARPDARLVADANEAWLPELAADLFEAAAQARIELIEQPFPAQSDEILRSIPRSVAVCADESLHTRDGLPRLSGLYDAINIKLDKSGGLTEALALKREARKLGLKIMVGSMVATSLAAAPAMLLAQGADWVDLDGPLLLARDRDPAIEITDGVMAPPAPELWG